MTTKTDDALILDYVQQYKRAVSEVNAANKAVDVTVNGSDEWARAVGVAVAKQQKLDNVQSRLCAVFVRALEQD